MTMIHDVMIGDRAVGDTYPCYITFEAGPTHDGLESAIRLANHAAHAGADAVKFQVVDPDRLVADKSQTFSYEVLVDRQSARMETVTEPLYDILCRRVLTFDEWRQLKQHCDTLGLAFFATPNYEDSIDLLEDLGCHSIKIASGDVNHLPLIRYAARTGACIQLDTGGSTLGEIERAVDVIRREGNERIIIHQCPSGYPARLKSINLNILQTIKQMFQCPAAFSDHTPGWVMDVAALAKGANLLEKTITENRLTKSIEHVMSLEPNEMEEFIRTVREVEVAMGKPRRIIDGQERVRRDASRRSLHLLVAVKAGTILTESVIEYKRPGTGITPDTIELISGSRFRCDLPAGHQIQLSDLDFS